MEKYVHMHVQKHTHTFIFLGYPLQLGSEKESKISVVTVCPKTPLFVKSFLFGEEVKE